MKILVKGIRENKKNQVLLGATGIGKTYTIANVIEKVNKPTLIIEPNKTLAGQFYAEMKELFPNNHVEYFISFYDVSTFPMLFSADKSTKMGLNQTK